MLPVGKLMTEHRLIERMMKIASARIDAMEAEGVIDASFVETLADFFLTYADQCHHGKEEDILFRALSEKSLEGEHREIMGHLIEQHIEARRRVGELLLDEDRQHAGDDSALVHAIKTIRWLCDFYPKHVLREDTTFFRPCMNYFTDDEKEAMLEAMARHDAKQIHEKYKAVVTELEE